MERKTNYFLKSSYEMFMLNQRKMPDWAHATSCIDLVPPGYFDVPEDGYMQIYYYRPPKGTLHDASGQLINNDEHADDVDSICITGWELYSVGPDNRKEDGSIDDRRAFTVHKGEMITCTALYSHATVMGVFFPAQLPDPEESVTQYE